LSWHLVLATFADRETEFLDSAVARAGWGVAANKRRRRRRRSRRRRRRRWKKKKKSATFFGGAIEKCRLFRSKFCP
jgi:hypothetical protein